MDVDEFVSDHKATYISVQININLSTSYYREVWNYKNADFERLNNLISTYNWDVILNENFTIDQSCARFTELFLKFCKECIPCKKVLIRKNDKPWFNSELRYNIKLRDRLWKRFFKSKSNLDRMSFKRSNNLIQMAWKPIVVVVALPHV